MIVKDTNFVFSKSEHICKIILHSSWEKKVMSQILFLLLILISKQSLKARQDNFPEIPAIKKEDQK